MTWIKVGKRDPPKFVNVLVLTNYGQIAISCIDGDGDFDTYCCEVNKFGTEDDEVILYWKPRPALPRGFKPIPKPKTHNYTSPEDITLP